MKKFSLFFLSLFILVGANAQFDDSSDNWDTMADVKYVKSQDEYGEIYVPEFGDEVKKMEGELVTLKGYIVPFEGMFKPEQIILSSLPIASCFFCGGSGPETVAEIHFQNTITYSDKPVSVRGKLKLNNTDYDQLMYVLTDAEYYSEKNKRWE